MEREDFSRLFGEFVRYKRESQKWTQSELASRLGNNFQNVSRIERGELNSTIYWTTLLASAFGSSLSDLMKEFELYKSEKQTISKHSG